MVRRTRTDINSHSLAGTLQQELFPLSVLLHGIEKAIRKIVAPVGAGHDNIESEVKAAEMRLLTAIAKNLTKTRERFTEMLTGRAGNLQNMRILFRTAIRLIVQPQGRLIRRSIISAKLPESEVRATSKNRLHAVQIYRTGRKSKGCIVKA